MLWKYFFLIAVTASSSVQSHNSDKQSDIENVKLGASDDLGTHASRRARQLHVKYGQHKDSEFMYLPHLQGPQYEMPYHLPSLYKHKQYVEQQPYHVNPMMVEKGYEESKKNWGPQYEKAYHQPSLYKQQQYVKQQPYSGNPISTEEEYEELDQFRGPQNEKSHHPPSQHQKQQHVGQHPSHDNPAVSEEEHFPLMIIYLRFGGKSCPSGYAKVNNKCVATF